MIWHTRPGLFGTFTVWVSSTASALHPAQPIGDALRAEPHCRANSEARDAASFRQLVQSDRRHREYLAELACGQCVSSAFEAVRQGHNLETLQDYNEKRPHSSLQMPEMDLSLRVHALANGSYPSFLIISPTVLPALP
jgi:hypothetical protein